MNNAGHYINRQGNLVTVRRDDEGKLLSVEVKGTGSNRAFQAQLRAAQKRAGMVSA